MGISRAYKHTDEPSRENLQKHIRAAIMNNMCEVFEFNELSEK